MKIEKVMCVCVCMREREERLFMDLSKAFNKEELIYSFCEKGKLLNIKQISILMVSIKNASKRTDRSHRCHVGNHIK